MYTLVTGSAGFIGFHLSKRLLNLGQKVIGLDSLNNYYDINLKLERNNHLKNFSNKNGQEFNFIKLNIEDRGKLEDVFEKFEIKTVINLAAQAGVRYSLENPYAYINSNISGFNNILEMCRRNEIEHLIYASSSSVYGGNQKFPFSEKDSVDHPISLYAATKKANELMAHTYSHLYNLPTTGLRFFTVYGPWGRPDMALFLFTKSIIENKPIKIFNHGDMKRDFTYIDDIIESLVRVIKKIPKPNQEFNYENPSLGSSWAPYKVFNIGNSKPTPLMDFITAIEEKLGIEAKKDYYDMQPGDVSCTSADTSELENWIGFKPNTSVNKGISEFINWYKDFYKC
tara:strand:- start:4029 stop:5051 length:1023 start_codon:yes stop_codon:yes gene_type:complete